MATIRERVKRDGRKVYQAQVRMTGFPARTASFPTRRLAERWATTIEADMIEGKHFRSVDARRRTLGEAIDRYVESELPKKRDRTPASRLAWWKSELGDTKLAAVTPALIVEKRDKLARSTFQRARPESKRTTIRKGEAAPQFKRSRATVDRYLANLSHVLTVARKEWHWISQNPFDGVSRFGGASGRTRYLSDDERGALLAETAKDHVLHCFVVLALTTACRAGELQKLEWSDVDLKTGRLLFRETKNTQPRTAWAQGAALELLKAHGKVRKLRGRVFESATGRMYRYQPQFKAAVAAAGVDDFRFHDLRHSAATYLAQAGATEQQLRAIGGWKSNVVSKYVHLAAEDAKAALAKLAEKVGGK